MFVDVLADVGFILYDLSLLRTDPCNGGWHLLALGLDVLGAVLPFATGLGMAARTTDHLDDVADVARSCINSFSADTPVATPAGPVPISEIEVGDQVLAYHEATRTTGSYTVTDVIVHTDPVILALTLDGEVVETTPEHPFFVLLRGWVKAGDLRVGDVVRQRDGAYGMVNAVAVVAAPQPMYNLTVADAHTFFVGEEGWLVHNCAKINTAPNPFGRRGNPAHQARVAQAERQLARLGWKTISGGSRPEQAVRIPATGRNRYPDLVMQKDGNQVAIQVGRATGSGQPVARERRALQDLRSTGLFRHVWFLKY